VHAFARRRRGPGEGGRHAGLGDKHRQARRQSCTEPKVEVVRDGAGAPDAEWRLVKRVANRNPGPSSALAASANDRVATAAR
jgi:hypothetical protein